jgi:hypothetical protein
MNCELAAVGETDGYSTDDNDEPDGMARLVNMLERMRIYDDNLSRIERIANARAA